MSAIGPTRLIDPRGHRFGAALSVAILIGAALFNVPLLVGLIALALGVSAWFGTRYSALGRPWPFVRQALRVGPPAELESELPPRFAQALGSAALVVAALFFVAGFSIGGWALTLAVVALQTVLAVTGYCLGCRLYFLRWRMPGLFERLAR
jgi:hypothetical protein